MVFGAVGKGAIVGLGVLGSLASITALLLPGSPREEVATESGAAADTGADAADAGTSTRAPPPPDPGPPAVPPIGELLYSEARELLLRSGWTPLRSPVNPTGNSGLRYGNGRYVVEQNWLEVVSCSGTGLAPCKFIFRDEARNYLVMITYGEAPMMRVNDWWVTDDISDEI